MNASKDTNILNNYIESRLTKLETTQDNVNQTLIRLERKLDTLGEETKKQISSMESRIDNRINGIENRLNTLDNRLYQIMLMFPATLIGFIISRALHWL